MSEIVQKALKNEADQLAQEYGIDATRIYQILERTVKDIDVNKHEKILELGLNIPLPLDFSPSLYEALKYLPPNEALNLFDKDINELKQKIHYTKILMTNEKLLYTYEELEALTELIIYHLEINQSSLTKHGFALEYIGWPPFFDKLMTNLYYFEDPADPEVEFKIPQDKYDKLKNWACENKKDHLIEFMNKVNNFMFCRLIDSGDNNYIELLSSADIQKIESSREKLFKLKIDILKILLEAIHNKTAYHLWDECLKLLIKELTPKEIKFLLEIDYLHQSWAIQRLPFYYGEDYHGPLEMEESPKPNTILRREEKNIHLKSGGIFSLFSVILYYEREIKIGYGHMVRETLGDLISLSLIGIPSLPVGNYFKLVNHQEREILDKALVQIAVFHEQIKSFEKDFFRRFVESIRDEFGVDIMTMHGDDDFLKKRIKGKFIGTSSTTTEQKDISDLTDEQEREKDEFKYKCMDRIHIPGVSRGVEKNLIQINDHEIILGDPTFAIFLRLVLGLKKGGWGWVSTGDMRTEGLISTGTFHQPFNRIRNKFERYLLDKDGKKFIENNSGTYRISIHPDFVTYNKSELLKHKDWKTSRLAKELPKIP